MAGNGETVRSVIWVEDEPYQVTAASRWLARSGWKVVFESDIVEAARRLVKEEFHGAIMDLMVPGGLGDAAAGYRIWSTYRLQCWLGGDATRNKTNAKAGLSEQWVQIDKLEPLAANTRIPTMVLSAYHDRDVAEAMATVHLARTGRPITLCSKPLEARRIAEQLERITRPDEAPP